MSELFRQEKPVVRKTFFNLNRYSDPVAPRVFFDCPDRLTTSAYLGGIRAAADPREMDLLVTDSKHSAATLKKRFSCVKNLHKIGQAMAFKKQHLQVWKIARK